MLITLTRGERLLELLGLGGIVDDEGVQVTGATDLELDLAAVILDAAGYRKENIQKKAGHG